METVGSESIESEADQKSFAESVLVWILAGLAASWLALWVYGAYLSLDFFAAISYYGGEPPCGLTPPFQLGQHTFGDYALPWFWATSGAPWSGAVCAPSNYPPVAMAIHSVLSILPYGPSLLAYELILLVAMVGPLWWATSGADWRSRLAILSLGLMSAPVLVALDRGNNVGLLVPPLMLFAWGWARSRWVHVALGAGIATVLKLYPAMFFIVLVTRRKWRILAIALLATVTVTLAVWAAYPGPVGESIDGFRSSARFFGAPTVEGAATRNYSVLGGLLALADLGPTPLAESQAAHFLLAHPWLPGAAYFGGCCLLIYLTGRATLPLVSITLAALQLVPPVSYRYYSVFALVVVSLVVRGYFRAGEALPLATGPLARTRSGLLTAALVLTLTPLPLILPNSTSVYPMQALTTLPWVALLILELVAAAGRSARRASAETREGEPQSGSVGLLLSLRRHVRWCLPSSASNITSAGRHRSYPTPSDRTARNVQTRLTK